MFHHQFLTLLSQRGVLNAAEQTGVSVEEAFLGIAASVDHSYGRYEWSVSNDRAGMATINARPPVEELGWTPWERWSAGSPGPRHTATFHVGEPGAGRWVTEDVDSLRPLALLDGCAIEERFRRLRVDVALRALDLTVGDILGEAGPESLAIYGTYRWVVAPHELAADGPVVYGLPPMHRSDDCPWESWYRDKKDGSTIHHVHYTADRPDCTGQWFESLGAPQRPPEVLGRVWYWHDAESMAGALR